MTATHDGQRTFSYCAPKPWNSLPKSLKESETVTIFKKKLKSFLFRDYFNLKIAIRFYLLTFSLPKTIRALRILNALTNALLLLYIIIIIKPLPLIEERVQVKEDHFVFCFLSWRASF